ncbi:hypothetical protein GGR58DRAFT_230536 [Xylaria digitata]|nr:hypothetical protein GGR58DRAFT_230536 [Xylaria digitata]
MSASAPPIPNVSSDITYITSEPFDPKPLIADILRTRYCVPDSIFLVEGVDVVHTSKSKRWRAIRLLLGDGELCIQALMSPETHRFVDRGDITFGSYVKLEKFRVEWKDISQTESTSSDTGGSGDTKKAQMVYLIVESLDIVGWNNTLIDQSMAEQAEESGIDAVEIENEAPEDCQAQSHEPEPEKAQDADQTVVADPEPKKDEEPLYLDDDFETDDDFEIMAIPENKTAHNREEVATATVNHAPKVTTGSSVLPSPGADLIKPVKLTKLRSIPNLPFKQNWSVNVLCVVSAISDLEPAGIPPYTQKQARLTDPSTDKHVLLTVFLDPQLFTPKVGSVVLLFGVKNHRFDGGSLKKYDSDRPKTGGSWWYENPTHLSWCDVDGLLQWWMQTGIQT